MGTISIVIPALDDEAMLRECLTALAAQTRRPDEIVVVDNGSTDGTAAVARSFGARVVDEPRRGILPATARGFDVATGDVIGRLDADSRPAPDWVATVASVMDADAGIAGVTASGTFYGGSRLSHALGKYLYLGGYFGIVTLFVGHTPLFGSNFAIRRAAWLEVRDRVHVDDPRVHDDLDLSFQLDPDMRVRYEPRLVVAISARPFDSFDGLWRRVRWGLHTIAVNWREIGWATRVRASARARRAAREA